MVTEANAPKGAARRPKIAIVDTDSDEQRIQVELARSQGVDVEVFHDRSAAGIVRNAAGFDGVITSYGDFSAQVFDQLPDLKVVSRTGVGFDNVDMDAATAHGVAVCNVPGYATGVVSDHAIALVMACLRRINEVDADMRRDVWDFARHRPMGQVEGRTFGVIGMGHIGRATALKAKGLGFKVVCASHSLAPGTVTSDGFPALSVDQLLETADVVSLHTALTPENHHLIDAARLAKMRPGSIVVNTARGPLIDTVALAEALENGRLWGAGLDVFEEEPLPADHPIRKAPHTVLGPHDAYFSEESVRELMRRSAQNAIDVVLCRKPDDCLNPQVFEQPRIAAHCAAR